MHSRAHSAQFSSMLFLGRVTQRLLLAAISARWHRLLVQIDGANQLLNYYINLTSRLDRRVFMERQFSELGIQANRVEATVPNRIPKSLLDEYCRRVVGIG